MDYFLTSDWHLGHSAMVRMCGRPEDFGDRILTNTLEALVGAGNNQDEDQNVLIHLGDLALGRQGRELLSEAIAKIKPLARLILVRGNHDDSLSRCYKQGWDFVCDGLTLNIFGRDCLFTHRPEPEVGSGVLNIHGHQHNNDASGLIRDGLDADSNWQEDHRLISCEFLEYHPIPLKTVVGMKGHPMRRGGRFLPLSKAVFLEHAARIKQAEEEHGRRAHRQDDGYSEESKGDPR